MSERPEPDLDIDSLVLADHQVLSQMLNRFEELAAEERAEQFASLVSSLVAHEVAEEQIVYPALRSLGEAVGFVVEQRLQEQAAAEEALSALEGRDPGSPSFADSLGQLRDMVLAHAAAEEREILPLLQDNRDTLDLTTMAVRYQDAKRRAPTHAHPHAPDEPPGNLTLGPVVSLVDRVRDALR